MRLSKLPTEFKWKYAIGEVALIVVGITIALAANSWYEGRKALQDERVLLQQMQQTLIEDLEELSGRSMRLQQIEQDITALLNHMEEDKPYSDDFGGYFRSFSQFSGVRCRFRPTLHNNAQLMSEICRNGRMRNACLRNRRFLLRLSANLTKPEYGPQKSTDASLLHPTLSARRENLLPKHIFKSGVWARMRTEDHRHRSYGMRTPFGSCDSITVK